MYVLSYVLITVQHHVPTTVDGDGFTFVEGRFGPFSTVAFAALTLAKTLIPAPTPARLGCSMSILSGVRGLYKPVWSRHAGAAVDDYCDAETYSSIVI